MRHRAAGQIQPFFLLRSCKSSRRTAKSSVIRLVAIVASVLVFPHHWHCACCDDICFDFSIASASSQSVRRSRLLFISKFTTSYNLGLVCAADTELTLGHSPEKESDISPGTLPANGPAQRKNSNKAPWEHPSFGNYRKDLAVLETAGNQIPSISRQPASATSPTPPWSATSTNGSVVMPQSVFGSFYNDSSEDLGQLSPGFRPGSGREEMGFPGDDRRPSVASQTTVSSSGSKSSIGRGFHKKLQGFFGEEFPGSDSRQNSDASLTTTQTHTSQPGGLRNRTNSVNNTISSSVGSRPSSPAPSRPRTPLPSSEVTPWVYQDQVSPTPI